jgi:hypothetical protein
MRRGSLERDFLKVRKVKVGTLGTIEHYLIIKDLAWNITWNNVGTKRHFVGKFKVLDKQNRIVYSLISENGNKGIPKKAKGYRVATMTVPKQGLEKIDEKKPHRFLGRVW